MTTTTGINTNPAKTVSGLSIAIKKLDYVQRKDVKDIMSCSKQTYYKWLDDPGLIPINIIEKLIAFFHKAGHEITVKEITKLY